jgi:hypothetical protein
MLAREGGHPLLVPRFDEENHFDALLQCEKSLDQVVNDDSDSLVRNVGKPVVAPNPDPERRGIARFQSPIKIPGGRHDSYSVPIEDRGWKIQGRGSGET